MNELVFKTFQTDQRDYIDLTYFPYAVKLERNNRDIPEDHIILTIDSYSLPKKYRTTTAIIIDKKQFINELLPLLNNFAEEIKDMIPTPTKKIFTNRQGDIVIIHLLQKNKVNLRYERDSTIDEKPPILKNDLTIEKANSFLKKWKFTERLGQFYG